MENRKWVAVGGWWLKEAWQWHPAQLTSLNLLFLLVWQLLLGRHICKHAPYIGPPIEQPKQPEQPKLPKQDVVDFN